MRRDLRGLAMSQALALAFLAGVPLAWVARELEFIFSNHRILVGLRIQEQLGSRAGRAARGVLRCRAWFIHALLGVLASCSRA